MRFGETGNVSGKSECLTGRLTDFMGAHGLTRPQLATLLRMPVETLDHWFEDDATPPACLLALMILFEAAKTKYLPAVRTEARAPSQSPFGSPAISRRSSDIEEALRRVRAI